MIDSRYNPKNVEEKWQKRWKQDGLYEVNLKDNKKPKYYNLVMFPYPSGDKLHLGHWYNYAPADSWGRFLRMKGFNVLEPMGFDSFGLPAENYAIKTGIHPEASTNKNVEYMRMQLNKMGTMYDWDKEVVTSSPEYYKWSQWVFLQLYKKGLAYRKNAAVNWCESCMTVLANEQVVDGECERCHSEVTKKAVPHWMFKITAYAEELLNYSELDWPEKTVLMQQNWIGKKEGININYLVKDSKEKITVFTTRPETNFGATFVVISPEHPLVGKLTTDEYRKKVETYIKGSKKKSDIERMDTGRKKTGEFTGSYALNPLTGYEMPIFVADYVLMGFGTGIVVGVPAHDQRDFEFAEAMKNVEVIRVIESKDGDKSEVINVEQVNAEEGLMMNSKFLDGLTTKEAAEKIMEYMEKEGFGEKIVNYRLHDWLISRQRYWGAPIPMIYCDNCGEVPVPEEELPVLLPEVKDYKPKGKSPLETNEKFMNVFCPKCSGPAVREGDTMDTFVCSSWYYFRYLDNKNKEQAWNKEVAKKWLPVDMYIGGPEHACMHLLYARFIHKVMRDLGYATCNEPFKKLVHQGLITKDGAKMSKSKGNVVSPDEFVNKYGADVFRMYLMFMGPFEQGGDWNDRGITGVSRFADKFWKFMQLPEEETSEKALKTIHKTIKKVGTDIENFQFNTAIASLMELINSVGSEKIAKEDRKKIIQLIAPLAPHLAEELWEKMGEKQSVFESKWPEYEEKYLEEDSVTIAIQINGKVRGQININVNTEKEEILAEAKELENVKKYLEGVSIVKEIYVPGKLVSLVVK